jgi:hypothetical protein
VNWYAAPTPAAPPISPLYTNSSHSGPLRTIQRNYAARAGDDAHGADILPPERVLHAGHDGTDGRGLERGARRVRERIPRVEGGFLVGHGGRGGRQCRPGSSLVVAEDGSAASSAWRDARALGRKQTTCIIGRINLQTAAEGHELAVSEACECRRCAIAMSDSQSREQTACQRRTR